MKKETKRKVLDIIKNNTNENNNTTDNVSPDVNADLAYSLFGKVYDGDPSTGAVPGARPMSEDEFRELVLKVAKDVLTSNGYDPNIADQLFLQWFGKTY